MFYVDPQRTVTRRDSSLIMRKRQDVDIDTWSTLQAQSTAPLTSDSTASVVYRPRGSVQKELVTMMFDSMLDSIVHSWETIDLPKPEESSPTLDFGKSGSEQTFSSKKKRTMC